MIPEFLVFSCLFVKPSITDQQSRMFCRSTQDTAVLPFVSTVLTSIPLYYHCHPASFPCIWSTSINHKLMENKETNVNMLTNTVRKDSGLTFLFCFYEKEWKCITFTWKLPIEPKRVSGVNLQFEMWPLSVQNSR